MNILKTTVLMALLTGLMVAIGGAINGSTGAMIMLIISLGMNFFSYWFSDSTTRRKFQKMTRRNFTTLLKLSRRKQNCQCRAYILLKVTSPTPLQPAEIQITRQLQLQQG